MKRDIAKVIQQYEAKYYGLKTIEGAFYPSDYVQIHDMSVNDVDAIFNALEAGFMIGYRKAKRDLNQQKKGV